MQDLHKASTETLYQSRNAVHLASGKVTMHACSTLNDGKNEYSTEIKCPIQWLRLWWVFYVSLDWVPNGRRWEWWDHGWINMWKFQCIGYEALNKILNDALQRALKIDLFMNRIWLEFLLSKLVTLFGRIALTMNAQRSVEWECGAEIWQTQTSTQTCLWSSKRARVVVDVHHFRFYTYLHTVEAIKEILPDFVHYFPRTHFYMS